MNIRPVGIIRTGMVKNCKQSFGDYYPNPKTKEQEKANKQWSKDMAEILACARKREEEEKKRRLLNSD